MSFKSAAAQELLRTPRAAAMGAFGALIEEECMRWLELVARLMQRLDSQIGVSRVLPIVLLVALSFSVYFVADVLLEIYRMHALIVFVSL
jgi:hypothetical protein